MFEAIWKAWGSVYSDLPRERWERNRGCGDRSSRTGRTRSAVQGLSESVLFHADSIEKSDFQRRAGYWKIIPCKRNRHWYYQQRLFRRLYTAHRWAEETGGVCAVPSELWLLWFYRRLETEGKWRWDYGLWTAGWHLQEIRCPCKKELRGFPEVEGNDRKGTLCAGVHDGVFLRYRARRG